jgi:hypothetical protein
MCKKLIYLISLVLVLALAGNASAVPDPNLVAYYTLDGDACDTGNVSPAVDGNLHGNPVWTNGRVGSGSIDLDGTGDFVQIPDANKLDITVNLTVAFWLRVDNFGSVWQFIVIKGIAYDNEVWKFEQDGGVAGLQTGKILFVVEGGAPYTTNGTTDVNDGQWHHVAGVYDGATGIQTLYVDGVQDNSSSGAPHAIPTNDLDIFISMNKDGYYIDGGVDDLRIYNRALSADEIAALYNIPYLQAHDPNPNTGKVGVTADANLSWTAGDYADTHDVYLGTDSNNVNDANRTTPLGVLKSQGQDANSYDPCDPFVLGNKTYYWRIDEVNDACSPGLWKGTVWNFKTASACATNPGPADGELYAALDANLTWTAGYGAVRHKVYFGTTDANTLVAERKDPNDPNFTYYDPPGNLTKGQKYYWKIIAYDYPTGGSGNYAIGPVWDFRATTGLRGWWTFDDGDGNTPNDSSGNNNDAVFGVSPNSLPAWTTEGRVNGALEFDGDQDWVEVRHDPNFDITKSMTATVWIKINDFGGNNQSIIGKYNNWKFERAGTSGTILWCIEGGAPWNNWGDIIVDDGEWHHLAGVYDGATGYQYLYVDGVQDVNAYDTPHPLPTSTNPLYIGSNGLNCVIDDLRVYDYNLTAAEIWDLYNVPWPYAHSANPANRSTVAMEPDKTLTLSWTAGTDATSHDVYFGTDFNDVNDANRTNPLGVLKSQGQTTTTYASGTLAFGTTYYWRIDELGAPGSPWKGVIWRFTTSNYLVVEDFNSYAGDNALRAVWKEGSPIATVYLNTDSNYVRDGNSMQYHYDLYDKFYSEAYANTAALPSQIGSNWAAGGVKALALWFYGQAGNDANEPMYVKLTDGGTPAKTAKVIYDGDMNDIKKEEWHEWNIALKEFVDNNNVNLANVKEIAIGFGDGIAEPVEDKGTVYFEDIRLYIPRCIPGLAPDLTGDCFIDYDDLQILTSDWLESEYNVPAVTPSDANLVALYEFEGDFNDSSNGHDGDPYGDATTVYDPVINSNVLSLDGTGDYVIITDSNQPGSAFDITGTITVACWIKIPNFDKDWQAIVTKGDSAWRLGRASGTGTGIGVEFACSGLSPSSWVSGEIRVDDDQWHHVAGVYDGSRLCIYVDGILDSFENTSGSISNNTYNVLIGENEEMPGREWNGQIDDVRIYNRALSHGEIVSLAGESQVTQPLLRPEVDLHKDGKVNLRDYAVLASKWLEEVLWP